MNEYCQKRRFEQRARDFVHHCANGAPLLARHKHALGAEPATREKDIVAEVMAMQTMLGGASRDDYLRRRLQQERETAYAGRP